MRFDDILIHISEFGRYQKIIYFLVCVNGMMCAMQMLAQVFMAGRSDHWCNVAGWEDVECTQWDLTEEQCAEAKRNASMPVNGTEDELQCSKYVIVDDLQFSPDLDPANYNNTDVTSCNDGWVYDRSQYHSSVVQEFDLVCSQATLTNLAQSLFFVGVLLGSVIFGAISDIIGRRIALYIALALQGILGAAIAFSPNYVTFTTLRVILAAANMGVFLMAFVIGTELVGPSKRTVAGIVIELFFSFGYMLLALLAYFIRDWWILQLVISAPSFIMLLTFPFVPESARWLITRGRTEQATKIIVKAGKVNKVDLPTPLFSEEELKEQEAAANTRPPSMIELFRTPNLRVRTLNCMFNWFVNTLVYYGLSLSTSDLGVNDYIAFFISGAVEVPAYISSIFAIDYFGRKWSMFGYMMGGGIACLCTIFTPLGPWRTTVAMIGKFGISASFAIIYVYSAELFPTPVRSVGVGLCSMSARIAGILAPIILLLNETWEPLPVLIFGVASIAAGLLILLLPETLGEKLPETIEEGELFGTKKMASDVTETYVEKKDGMPEKSTNGKVNEGYDHDIELEDK
ncbi:organic cation transporter protein-like [Diadema antillarum]|uniref:organic cation transporter protein-like n=1 Tax=Diadema antillarum TaxID=105358 RepID=UPI003A86975B